jgi:hypothetical protein
LPSLTSVKESKLSKHTIVDESLKYHEVQKAKLEDLQKTVDALRVEKETLVAELAGWRECLDAAPVELLEANAVQGEIARIGSSDIMSPYDSIALPGPVTTHEIPAILPASYNMQANAIPNPMPDVQLPDNYTLQASGVMLADDFSLNDQPRTSQCYLAHGGTRNQLHQHAFWSTQQGSHMQQPLWTQSSYQELPLDFQQHQFLDQGYDLHTG